MPYAKGRFYLVCGGLSIEKNFFSEFFLGQKEIEFLVLFYLKRLKFH